MKSKTQKLNLGFTLVEVLVVLAIISVLMAVAFLSLKNTRDKGRIARAQADVRNIFAASQMLFADTGKWPGGCPETDTGGFEFPLATTNNTGLSSQPSAGTVNGNCLWTPEEVDKWKGPYLNNEYLFDPWGVSYYFDQDYHSPDNHSIVYPAILTWGANKTVNIYDQDNISIRMK